VGADCDQVYHSILYKTYVYHNHRTTLLCVCGLTMASTVNVLPAKLWYSRINLPAIGSHERVALMANVQAKVQAKHDKISKVIGTAVCTGVLAGGWALLAASSGLAMKTTYDAAQQVPSLSESLKVARANEVPSGYTPLPTTLVNAQNKRKTPVASELEAAMLILTVYAEAANQGVFGMQAVAAATINRTGTVHGLTLAEVIRSPNQYSFVNVTEIGKLIGRNSQQAIIAEAAKPKYDFVKAALAPMFDQKTGTYIDYAAGTDYYYNPKTSSPNGKAWFEKSTYRVFCHLSHCFQKVKQKGKV